MSGMSKVHESDALEELFAEPTPTGGIERDRKLILNGCRLHAREPQSDLSPALAPSRLRILRNAQVLPYCCFRKKTKF